eukprot:NODE_291_length_11621_cov_0.390557.p8 type:complete len:132 gc:universal NODE_291_length_11621_cov_0.390557:4140-3745(-)
MCMFLAAIWSLTFFSFLSLLNFSQFFIEYVHNVNPCLEMNFWRSSTKYGSRPPPESLLPKYIWSPTGGAYTQTKHWKTNFVFILGLSTIVCYSVFQWGRKLEIRPRVPDTWIPTMMYDKELEQAYLNKRNI